MNSRIQHLKTMTDRQTDDIAVYRALEQTEYVQITDKAELFRKAHFLTRFSENIPVVIDENELIVGSMRFMRNKTHARNKGHIIVDYQMLLWEGIPGMQKKIRKLSTEASKAFGEAVEAFSLFIRRHAQTAQAMGMEQVAANCDRLLIAPPQTFHEALQLIWFAHLFLHAEGHAKAVSFGRFDDYLYPFYKNDLDTGTLTREQAKELLMCFWLKTCEGDESQNLTLGGNKENELTHLCLEVTCELRVKQPSVSVRISDTSSNLFWQKTTELIKCKIGMPAIFNDKTVIKSLQNVNVDPSDAENYAIVGCYEANSPGNTFGTTANAGVIYLTDVLQEFLALEQTYSDFPGFYESFKAFFTKKYHTDILKRFRENWDYIRDYCVSPFQSACMGSCLANGIPTEWGGCKYTMAGINILGIGTLIDSLHAIKQIVFETREWTYADFIRQVKNNFPDRSLARKCRNLPGKYGTDSSETNVMAEDLSVFIADLIDSGEIYEGVKPYAGLFIFLNDIYSTRYEATPDGRLQGERVSYGVGASDICSGKTVTSVLNAASHIANDRFADGNPLMFHISEKEVAGEKGDLLLRSLIQSYFEKGGFHLQFNVTDGELLRKAKENPEDYSDLIVRISGYSTHFTKLNDAVQTALIERS